MARVKSLIFANVSIIAMVVPIACELFKIVASIYKPRSVNAVGNLTFPPPLGEVEIFDFTGNHSSLKMPWYENLKNQNSYFLANTAPNYPIFPGSAPCGTKIGGLDSGAGNSAGAGDALSFFSKDSGRPCKWLFSLLKKSSRSAPA